MSDPPVASGQDMEIPFGLRHDSEIGAGIMHQVIVQQLVWGKEAGEDTATRSRCGWEVGSASGGGWFPHTQAMCPLNCARTVSAVR